MHTYTLTATKSTSESQVHQNYLLTYGPGARTGRHETNQSTALISR